MSSLEKAKDAEVSVQDPDFKSSTSLTSDGFSQGQDEGRAPTDEEMKTLRHVSGKIPLRCWLVAIVELAERFAYYGLSAPFQNYMQNSPEDSPKGVLNLKNQGATALSYFFQFWCYLTPIFGGWLADTYWGKFKTIFVFCCIYIVGIFVLFISSIPSIASKTGSLIGYIIAIVIIGLATGGVKSNVSPLIADQVPKTKPVIKVLASGERVIVDPNVTIQNVFMFFYLMINVGSLSVIATTQLEHHVGFWAAYLLPFCFFFIAIIALVLGRNQYVKMPVSDKIVNKTFQCVIMAAKNNFNLDAARPSLNPDKQFNWDDHFVDQVKRALYGCKVFAFYPIYWVVYGQMVNNFVSQAGQMELHGLPNDILQAINSLAIIIFIPICERIVYPFIRKFTPFKAITKIFFGFMFASSAMVYAAVLQHYIYSAGPCFDHPKACAPEFRTVPNHIHVAIQAPAYFLIAMSEILASVTGLEYAYTKAPVSMKSFITSLFLATNAVGSALGIALSSTSVDPKLVWTFTGLAVACFIAGCCFWLCFNHYNAKEDELNQLEYKNEEGEVTLEPITSMKSIKSLA
ncbi:PTR2-domain-containing protein [Suhomyces tanzawaensis NRRL Y-17324]|uniref:PTR2-domain-containing protein n=1 Tax=Suhomyces tanzawaensis NRRL Y-17324 TaxID=984487 RepID=A0A1E4SPU1_9ASCO|nr:PTR2-domain-containing protein [Suhomyces tanzawaensis NRRL Y-17324]ODV81506.1 PTR2-domain-containing protein [Suhomyces tanzawaensis NRRL Y-17324]